MVTPHRTLVLSDVHLCTVVRGDDGAAWMRHRRRRVAMDADLAATIDQAVRASGRARLEIVLNGDVFDFDTPPAVTLERGVVPPQETHLEPGAVAAMGAILGDHPRVADALARALWAGAWVVVVPGNHDAQLGFRGVRNVLADRLGHSQRLSFRHWFHRTPYGLHLEHGHQYDPSCALQGIGPVLADGLPRVDDTLGSVTAYYGPCLSAGTNPYVFDPLDVAPRDLVEGLMACLRVVPNHLSDFSGTARRMVEALRAVDDRPRPLVDAATARSVLAETGSQASPDTLDRHAALMTPGISLRTFLMSGTFARFVPSLAADLRRRCAAIAAMHQACGVVVGHTHRAGLERDPATGVWHANTGTWAPDAAVPRTFLWVEWDGGDARPALLVAPEREGS